MDRFLVAAFLVLGLGTTQGSGYLSTLPDGFNSSQWAFVNYADPSVAVLSGSFNRSVFDAPFESTTSDESLAEA